MKLEATLMVRQSAWQLPKRVAEVFYQMKAHYFSQKIGRVLAALFFVISIGFLSSSAVQAQWWPNATGQRQRDRDYRRDRNRDNRRNRDQEWRRRNRNRNDEDWRYRGNGGYGNGGYGNISQAAANQGIQDGVYTGSRDAQRGQSYNPQRSHFYRNGHGDNGGYGRSLGRDALLSAPTPDFTVTPPPAGSPTPSPAQ